MIFNKGWIRPHWKLQGWWKALEECCILNSVLTTGAIVLAEAIIQWEKNKRLSSPSDFLACLKIYPWFVFVFLTKVQQTKTVVFLLIFCCLTELLSFSGFLHTPSINHSGRGCPAECNLTPLHLFTVSCNVTAFIWISVKTGTDLSDNKENPEKD